MLFDQQENKIKRRFVDSCGVKGRLSTVITVDENFSRITRCAKGMIFKRLSIDAVPPRTDYVYTRSSLPKHIKKACASILQIQQLRIN